MNGSVARRRPGPRRRRPSCCCATSADAGGLDVVAAHPGDADGVRGRHVGVPRRAGRRRETRRCPCRAPTSPALAARFDCTATLAHALVGAALRETFEETGVLLSVPAVRPRRAACAGGGRHASPSVTLLAEHDLVLDAGALQPWARWITPAGETRRYDTRFFVGALPADAQAAGRHHRVQCRRRGCRSPPRIEQAQRGERKLLPPTMATLTSLLPFSTVADVLTAATQRSLEPVAAEDSSSARTASCRRGCPTAPPRRSRPACGREPSGVRDVAPGAAARLRCCCRATPGR